MVATGADLLLQVRCAVYNGTLGSGFGDRSGRISNADLAFAKAASIQAQGAECEGRSTVRHRCLRWQRSSIMNTIVLEPISETPRSSTSTIRLALTVDETVGWKTEAQRLAQGANRCAREPRQ
jgi:hypothetical protein